MPRINMVRIRRTRGLESDPSFRTKKLFKLIGKRDLLHRLEQSKGMPFMPHDTPPYLWALDEERGGLGSFTLTSGPRVTANRELCGSLNDHLLHSIRLFVHLREP
jgi:hypothetical protein